MNLTLSEIAELPLAAALFGRDYQLIARTPEWRGTSPGSLTYRVRGNRLVTAGAGTDAGCDAILMRLLDALDAASLQLTGTQSLQVRMLATALRVVAGRVPEGAGRSDQVVHFARAGIRARTALDVTIEDHDPWELQCPEVAALVLVQLAVNAERHSGAKAVSIGQSAQTFHISWRGPCGKPQVVTSRRRRDRERWGLGFGRIAADALGGAIYAPHSSGGVCASVLELGLNRLALPLAAVRRGVVSKATRAWDEETRLLPGTAVESDRRLEGLVVEARAAGGGIATSEGWCSREGEDAVWIAIPGDGVIDRARDVVDGIAHERALWDGVAEPVRSCIAALAALLGSRIGSPLQRAPALAWDHRMRELAPMFQLVMPVPDCPAAGALDPRVTAFLASEIGERFDVDGERMWLRVRPADRDDPLVSAFPETQRDLIPLT